MFSIIVAHSSNLVIGRENKIPWFLPTDLKRFKELTTGHKILMGRKTFYSLPKVLPNRQHIVLSRNKNLIIDDENVFILNDIKKFIIENKDSREEIFIIGGEEIYNLFAPYCKKFYITELLESFNGDAFFPDLIFKDYNLTFKSNLIKENNIEFLYKNYEKK
ncbi:MAG: dihydrofolate reductase [Sarcina sp.]